MRKSIIILFVLALLFTISVFFVACNEDVSVENQTKVVFEMEGGVYKNCEGSIVYYYPLEEGEDHLIIEPKVLTSGKEDVTKEGFVLKGWYRTKEELDGSVVYSDEWDFANDKITAGEEVTLYAKWKSVVNYTYKLCYLDGENEVDLWSYEVDEGDNFSDYLGHCDDRNGFTFLKFVDQNGADWDTSFKHPGGEEDLEIKVYASYIEGEYELVSTAKELKSAASKGRNIYLLNDIDLDGAALTFKKGYSGTFQGNGYTVSNFKLSYADGKNDLIEDYEDDSKNSLMISLFGETENAVISNVNFVNVKLDISTINSLIYKIYVAPISVKGGASLENVSFAGTYTISKLPKGFIQGDVVDYDKLIVAENAPWIIEGESKCENSSFSFVLENVEE